MVHDATDGSQTVASNAAASSDSFADIRRAAYAPAAKPDGEPFPLAGAMVLGGIAGLAGGSIVSREIATGHNFRSNVQWHVDNDLALRAKPLDMDGLDRAASTLSKESFGTYVNFLGAMNKPTFSAPFVDEAAQNGVKAALKSDAACTTDQYTLGNMRQAAFEDTLTDSKALMGTGLGIAAGVGIGYGLWRVLNNKPLF